MARINAETKKIVATKDFQQRFDAIGMIPDQDRTPDEINAYIKSEIAKWAKVIKDAGVSRRISAFSDCPFGGPKTAKTWRRWLWPRTDAIGQVFDPTVGELARDIDVRDGMTRTSSTSSPTAAR